MAPNVIVTCETDLDAMSELQTALLDTSGEKSLLKYLHRATTWLQEHKVSPSVSLPADNESFRKKKKKGKKNEEEDIDVLKKASMKTADDVIKRIMWDENLQADEFLVGYLDRFLGVLEKSFTVFSWEDLASVDYTVLAIPKHRIQYFKYKNVKVWDKKDRFDNVFGSVGSGITIMDVIRTYAELPEALKNGEQVEQTGSTKDGRGDDSDDDEDDDDDDDDVTVTIGSTAVSAVDKVVQDSPDECDDTNHDVNWRNKMRPNYFLCQRITDPNIIERVGAMQTTIAESFPQYKSCLIPASSLHITLCTLGLDTPEQVQETIELLHRSRLELSEMVRGGIKVDCSHIDNFFNRVVYIKVSHEEKFSEYVEHVRALIRLAGINIRDNHDFVPHMTVMKVSRPVARETYRKTVPYGMYKEFKDVTFGSQVIDGIYLCEMKADKCADGFYISPAHIDL